MNRYREKVSNVLKIVCRKSAYIDNNHSMTGIRLWFESGQDVYDFIIRQPEFEWEIVPELDVINIITGQLQNFDVVYTPTGVSSRLSRFFCKSMHYNYSCTGVWCLTKEYSTSNR